MINNNIRERLEAGEAIRVESQGRICYVIVPQYAIFDQENRGYDAYAIYVDGCPTTPPAPIDEFDLNAIKSHC